MYNGIFPDCSYSISLYKEFTKKVIRSISTNLIFYSDISQLLKSFTVEPPYKYCPIYVTLFIAMSPQNQFGCYMSHAANVDDREAKTKYIEVFNRN